MAVIPSSRASKLYDSGGTGERTVLYLLKQVDTADTYDCASEFVEVKRATFVAAGELTAAGTVVATGTSLAFTLATMADDAIFLLVIGSPA